ncbi:MAG: hypothetical protein WCI02_05525 [Planctomycetota bacterium]
MPFEVAISESIEAAIHVFLVFFVLVLRFSSARTRIRIRRYCIEYEYEYHFIEYEYEYERSQNSALQKDCPEEFIRDSMIPPQ